MSRYDWPAPPKPRDNPTRRRGHNTRFRPEPDVSGPDGAPPRAAPDTPGLSRDVQARNPPTGNEHLWFPIGPSVMTNGQASGTPNVAGRIRDLQVEPIAGLRAYAASASGGVWFSGDRGDSWRPLDEWVMSPNRDTLTPVGNALACGAIHVVWGAAADGSQDDVWVGTGELYGGAGGTPGGKVVGIGLMHAVGPATGTAWAVDPVPLRGHTTYRIAGDPGRLDQLVAATDDGLYARPAGGAWTKVGAWPPAAPAGTPRVSPPVDVVMTRPSVNVLRIWVAAVSRLFVAEFAGSPSTPITPATLTFQPVAFPNMAPDSRVQIATAPDGLRLFVLSRRPAAGNEKHEGAHLWSVDTAAAIAGLTATELPGLPPDLFMSASDQSFYDMCIAVHPDITSRVYVGGAAVSIGNQWNGAIYRCETTASAATPTLIGEGVHSDVHVLRVGPRPSGSTKRAVWVGCDGGVFRSDDDGDPRTFRTRNDGLAVLEPGFIACHPTNAGIVVAGFQDNGTAIRDGDSVWRQTFRGDGGGLAFDRTMSSRYMRQYTFGDWESSDGGAIAPVQRRGATAEGTAKTSEKVEESNSNFYSGCHAVAHGGDTHFAMGTDRVWYTRDWGRHWMTLPTATDPRAGKNPDLAQDLLDPGTPNGQYSDTVPTFLCCTKTYHGSLIGGPGVIAVKFMVPADSGANHVLRVLALYNAGLVWLEGTRAISGTGAFTWTRRTAQLFRDPANPGETTSFMSGASLLFLPASGIVNDVAVHDADRGPLGSCYVTTIGERTLTGTGAQRDTLWWFDGDSTWVPCGLRVNSPNGVWAAGQRVTAPALSVVVDPGDPATVFVGTSVGVVRGHLTIGVDGAGHATYTWAWDQFANGLPEAAVQDLAAYMHDGVRLLRAGLQARGVWETDLANAVTAPLTYLRLFTTDTRRRLPTPLIGPTTNGEPTSARWDDSPDIVVDTSGRTWATPPTEADLMSLPRPRAARSVTTPIRERRPKVHVLVHHRWATPAAANDVRVVLARHALGTADVPIGGLWAALVAAAGTGTEPATLPDGWTKAGATLWQNPAAPIDDRMPRSVTFDLDLGAEAEGTAFVLLAVVMSGSNQITPADLRIGAPSDATTVIELVMRSPHVAARTVQLT